MAAVQPASQPTTSQPTTSQPTTSQPTTSQPTSQPPTSQPSSIAAKPQLSQPAMGTQAFVSLIMGISFGFALHRSRVFEPVIIREQMLMNNFIMMKMYLSAMVTSLGIFLFFSSLSGTKELFAKARVVQTITTIKYGTAFLGGVILGLGMTISGACPGTVLAQIGSGVPSAWATLCGGLLGALCYGAIQPNLPFDAHTLYARGTGQKPTCHWLETRFGLSFFQLAMFFTVAIAFVLLLLEINFPWKTDLLTELYPRTSQWSPIMGGIIVGSLQAPAVLICGKLIGSSSSYVTFVAKLVPRRYLQANCDLFSSKRDGIGNWWQVIYVSGAIVGSYLSASGSQTYGMASGVHPFLAFLGGFALIFGARWAQGCTSGHGISGIPLLNEVAMVAVIGMFAGAIGLAHILKAVNLI